MKLAFWGTAGFLGECVGAIRGVPVLAFPVKDPVVMQPLNGSGAQQPEQSGPFSAAAFRVVTILLYFSPIDKIAEQ